MINILIIAEHADDKLKRYSIELAGKAVEMCKKTGGSVSALLFGRDLNPLANELGNYGVSRCLVASHEDLVRYSGEGYAKVLCDVVSQGRPDVVLATAQALGCDVMARAAMRLATGLASDCVAIDVEGGVVRARRPIYGGRVLTDVTIKGRPQMATLRPNIFPLPQPSTLKNQVAVFAADPGAIKAKVVDVVEAEVGMVDLAEADRIVAGGRAMGSADNFRIIRLRFHSAPGGNANLQGDCGHKQGSRGPHLLQGRLWDRGRSVCGAAGHDSIIQEASCRIGLEHRHRKLALIFEPALV